MSTTTRTREVGLGGVDSSSGGVCGGVRAMTAAHGVTGRAERAAAAWPPVGTGVGVDAMFCNDK